MLKISGVGAAVGFLGAVGIYFEPQEPYPGYITLAGTLFGVTTALLITTVVTRNSSLGQCLLWGAIMGLLGIIHYAQMYRFEHFMVEDNHFQAVMVENLERRARDANVKLKIKPLTNRANKQSRIANLEPEVTQGHLRFSRRHELLLDQLLQFPLAVHDDGPDALEMAVEAARQPAHFVKVWQI